MKNNTNCKSFVPNLKDYLIKNEDYKTESIKEYDEDFFKNIMKNDIESLKLPNYALLEAVALGMIIAAIVLLILAFLLYFNILDIKSIVQGMKQCIM